MSTMETMQFGQSPTFYGVGAVVQHTSGQWYVKEQAGWRAITEQEAQALLAKPQ